MRYNLYIKQAWQLMRQERFFSAVYIISTGLAISMVMVLSISFYLKLANLYPENNRDRTLSLKMAMVKNKKGGISSAAISLPFIQTCVADIPDIEAMTITYRENLVDYLQPIGTQEQIEIAMKPVNTDFWTVYPFRFLAGKPFSKADEESAIRATVITEGIAKRLFGEADKAIGQEIFIGFKSYQVRGVVQGASALLSSTYAQVYVPFSLYKEEMRTYFDPTQTLGYFNAMLLVKEKGKVNDVKQQVIENVRRYGQIYPDYEISLLGQPDKHWQSVFRRLVNTEPDYVQEIARYVVFYLIFLLIPAVSLSGMADSRMERRMEELGIRRSFGASRSEIFRQVIGENLLFTFLGSLVGLLLSWVIFYFTRDWITDFIMNEGSINALPDNVELEIPFSFLFNWGIMAITLGVCLILNLLSALAPAWKYARRPIVESLIIK